MIKNYLPHENTHYTYVWLWLWNMSKNLPDKVINIFFWFLHDIVSKVQLTYNWHIVPTLPQVKSNYYVRNDFSNCEHLNAFIEYISDDLGFIVLLSLT